METSVYIHTLTFIILLRVANVKLAPLFARWKDVPLQHCFELHEILCLQHHGDVLANITVTVSMPDYDFDSLKKGLPVAKADWYRFVRRSTPLPTDVCRAGNELARKFRGPKAAAFAEDNCFAWTQQCVLLLHHLHAEDSSCSFSSAADHGQDMQLERHWHSFHNDVPSSSADTTSLSLTHLLDAREDDVMTCHEIESLSRASSEEDLSSVCGDESPPHLRQKFDLFPSCEEDLKRFRRVYIQALVDRIAGEDVGIAADVPTWALKLLQRDAEVQDLHAQLADESSDDPIEDVDDLELSESMQPHEQMLPRFKTPENYKYGYCNEHQKGFYICVQYGGLRPGQPVGRCPLFKTVLSNGKRACFNCKPWHGSIDDLPKSIQRTMVELKKDLRWSLRHGPSAR